MIENDYPAAHSMDTYWFAIDEAGEVAHMITGEEGPIPHNLKNRDGIHALSDILDKDGDGITLLPTQYDPSSEGHSTQYLEQVRLELNDSERHTLERIALEPDLAWYDPNIHRRFAHAIVLLSDVNDVKKLVVNFKRDYIIRLDRSAAIYYFVRADVIMALHLLAQGRLLAWRTIEDDRRHELSALGIYEFESSYDSSEQYLGEAIFQPKELPPHYSRKYVPKHARAWHALPQTDKLPTTLPGVRFSEMGAIQLADHIPCYSWSFGNHTLPHSVILANISTIRNTQSPARTATFSNWHQMAEEGDAIAQYSLGYLYSFNPEVRPDYVNALYWFKRAAEQADANLLGSTDAFENGSAAQCSVADMYERGLGVEQDLTQARHWYVKAAALDNHIAQYQLGLMYKNGLGVAQDNAQALDWFYKSKRQHYLKAEQEWYTLDPIVHAEQGANMNLYFARKLIQDPHEYVTRQLYEGLKGVDSIFWIDREISGEDIITRVAKIIGTARLHSEWIDEKLYVKFQDELVFAFQKDRYQEQDRTLVALAQALSAYYGIRCVRETDYFNSIAFFILDNQSWSALDTELGDKVDSTFKKISENSSYFSKVTKQSSDEIYVQQLIPLAEQGDIVAQYRLAYCFQDGRGIEQDYTQAVAWYRKIAEKTEAMPVDSSDILQNGAAAKCNLADKYEHGLGVSQDYQKAFEWYTKSAAHGSHVAQYSLGNLYRNGLGVPKDFSLARAWFEKSAKNGYEDAVRALEQMTELNE
jgi:TPR repeat protein